MRLFIFATILLSFTACSKKVDLPQLSQPAPWSKEEKQALNQTCLDSSELKTAVSNVSAIPKICNCYTTAATAKYTQDQIRSSDTAVEKQLQEFLRDCAIASGESVTFNFLSAVRGMRLLDEEKKPNLFEKTLKKVKKTVPEAKVEIPVKKETPPEPPTHTNPPEAKVTRPEAPAPVDEAKSSISRIAKNNRLVFLKSVEFKKDDSPCFRQNQINCCLNLAKDASLPISFKSGDSLVFSGVGSDPTPRDREPIVIRGRSYVIDSEYSAYDPSYNSTPESAIAGVNNPISITSIVCKKWDPRYRRNYNISIKEMRELFTDVADYELAGGYKDHPKVDPGTTFTDPNSGIGISIKVRPRN